MNANWTVYKHTSPSNKVYIGITSKDVSIRWATNGNGYYRQNKFHNAIKKYGWDNFKHEIIATNLTKEEAEELEIKLIAEYNSTDDRYGYNIAIGGLVNKGFKITEEAKEKMSKAKLGKPHNWSEEAIAKLSASKKGFVFTEEHKMKLSEAHKGKSATWNIGIPRSDEWKEKQRLSHLGKSPANKGIPMTEEQKKKLSESHKGKQTGADNPFAKTYGLVENEVVVRKFVCTKSVIEYIGSGNAGSLLRAIKNNKPYKGYYIIRIENKK